MLLCGCVGFRTPLDDSSGATSTATKTNTISDASVPCVPGSFGLAHARPTVMFVLDRSASMNSSMDDSLSSLTRWETLRSALATALPSVDQTIAIGALVFPAISSSNVNCSVASKADLLPALGNVATLTRLIGSTTPGGSTPTAQAIDTAAKIMLDLRAATQARALVLATDGGPNCNSNLSALVCRCLSTDPTGLGICQSSLECLDDQRTEQTIAKYQKQGLPTYVIGIQSAGDNTLDDVLNAMAIAGGRPRTGANESYYAATSASELNSALTTIRDQVGTCTFLTTSVPDQNGSIVVNINGNEIPSEQWLWGNKANGEIVLLGDACQAAVSDSAAVLSAVVGCSGG